MWKTSESGLDWQLVQNGFCSAFHRQEVLQAALKWLEADRYRIVQFNTLRWLDRQELHDDFAAGLNFPDYYGRNLDALNECLLDVAGQSYGWTDEDSGLVLVLDRYDALHRTDNRSANAILDIIENMGRVGSLFGHRILCLVQSDDPTINFDLVGARSVQWNPAECSESDRMSGE